MVTLRKITRVIDIQIHHRGRRIQAYLIQFYQGAINSGSRPVRGLEGRFRNATWSNPFEDSMEKGHTQAAASYQVEDPMDGGPWSNGGESPLSTVTEQRGKEETAGVTFPKS